MHTVIAWHSVIFVHVMCLLYVLQLVEHCFLSTAFTGWPLLRVVRVVQHGLDTCINNMERPSVCPRPPIEDASQHGWNPSM